MGIEGSGDRTADLARAFVELSGALVNGYDVVDLLDRLVGHCVELLDVDAAGLVLADATGALKVMVSTSEHARFLEVLQLHADSGPCLDCFRSGHPVDVEDLTADGRWPVLADTARQASYRAVYSIPLRSQDQTIGAMNLFSTEPRALGSTDHLVARALTEVATVTILGQRALHRSGQVASHLQAALNSRVVIEQAKGLLAQQGQLEIGDAFATLRAHARRHSQRLTDVARAVVDRTLTLQAMGNPADRGSGGSPTPR